MGHCGYSGDEVPQNRNLNESTKNEANPGITQVAQCGVSD